MSLYCFECKEAHFLIHPEPIYVVSRRGSSELVPICESICEAIPPAVRLSYFTQFNEAGLLICRASAQRGVKKSYQGSTLIITDYLFSLGSVASRLYLPAAHRRFFSVCP